MNNFFETVLENWQPICIVIFVVVSLIIAGIIKYRNGLESVRPWAYKAILAAENMYKHGDNETKFSYYFDKVYQVLPTFVRFFISKESLEKILEKWYLQIKDLLDNGVVDNSLENGKNNL